MAVIDAQGIYYQKLNQQIRELVNAGEKEIILDNVNGQRYLGSGINSRVRLVVRGTPGNDLAAFSEQLEIEVYGNGQDGIANTMGTGKLVIHGRAGDILAYGMRGGRVYIRDDVGYRAGIHMKGFQDQQPLLIIGGTAGDFSGEYMAGGRLVVLGLNRSRGEQIIGSQIGVGLHGGEIYVRGEVADYQVGREVKIVEADDKDREILKGLLRDYCQEFDLELEKIVAATFTKLVPRSSRPYGNIYAY